MHRLKRVLEALKAAELTLRLEKCEFGKKEIEAFRIRDIETPNSVRTELNAPQNIQKYAHIAEPLTRLTRKTEVFRWENEQAIAFDELKNILTKEPIAKLYHSGTRTQYRTDASAEEMATRETVAEHISPK